MRVSVSSCYYSLKVSLELAPELYVLIPSTVRQNHRLLELRHPSERALGAMFEEEKAIGPAKSSLGQRLIASIKRVEPMSQRAYAYIL